MLLSFDDQTIIAQCTPRGSGAIALLRMCGTDAVTIASSLAKLASSKLLDHQHSHTIHYGSIINSHGESIDNVLFLLMKAPHTFTGQDTVEITSHNNQFIIEEIIALAISHGARPAQEGEFTRRAVLNGKMDLVQAEAINDLIHAQTHMALKKSLAQMNGSFSSYIGLLEEQLIKALALSEASFEFLDEEMAFDTQIAAIITNVLATIQKLKLSFAQYNQIKDGIKIAIIGSVNAGKSSLFNALIKKERAIVTPIAGTTRDSIEAGMHKNGNYWTLIDTAGLRETDDAIEQEGIRRSLQEAAKADVILLAVDSSRPLTSAEQEAYTDIRTRFSSKIINVYTKADTALSDHAATESKDGISVSSKENFNITLLEECIERKIAQLFATMESPFVLNQRHYNTLLTLETKLHVVQNMLGQPPVAYELLSIHLTDALTSLTELTGKSISEAGMDAVFREFCVGK